jgi:hypothetical protein
MPLTVADLVAPESHEAVDRAATTEAHPAAATRHAWRYIIILLTGCVGVFASIGMFAAIAGWQKHVTELRFTGLAREQPADHQCWAEGRH